MIHVNLVAPKNLTIEPTTRTHVFCDHNLKSETTLVIEATRFRRFYLQNAGTLVRIGREAPKQHPLFAFGLAGPYYIP